MKWWGWILVFGSLSLAAGVSAPTEKDHLTKNHYAIVCSDIWAAGAKDDDTDTPAREAIRSVCNL